MRRQVVGQTGGILGGLRFDARERALGLGFDCADRLAVEIEQVVREAEARLHRELAHGDAATGGQVEVIAVLDDPAGSRQFGVDFAPGFLFGCFRHPPAPHGCD